MSEPTGLNDYELAEIDRLRAEVDLMKRGHISLVEAHGRQVARAEAAEAELVGYKALHESVRAQADAALVAERDLLVENVQAVYRKACDLRDSSLNHETQAFLNGIASDLFAALADAPTGWTREETP